MSALLATILNFFAQSFVKTTLLGAGLGLITSTVILEMVNKYIDSAINSMSGFGSVAGLMGLAGLDIALSIVIGALVCRVTISTLSASIGKVTGS